jgi:type I restriction enzyme S subunit
MMYNNAFIKDHVIKPKTWSPKKDAVGEHISYIDLSSVDKEDKTLVYSLIQNIDASEAPSRAKQLVHKDDILVATVRPNLNGVAIVSRELFNATASTGYCVLRTAESLHNKYLFYWVRSKSFVNDMIRKSTGASYPAVSDKIIKDSKIPLPPLEQQKKIAAILDAADAYRQKTKALIAKYDELTQSLFLDMFGDPVTNPKGWIKKTVLDIAKTLFAGGDVPKNNFSKESNKDYNIPIYSNGLNEKALYGFTNLAKVNEESITLSARGTIGHPEVRKAPFYPIIRLIVITPKIDIIHSQYLKRALSFLAYTKGGSSIPQLTIPMVKDKEVLIPPKELQNQFAERVQAIETQKAQAQASLAQAEDLFNSLLQKAFKGELTS